MKLKARVRITGQTSKQNMKNEENKIFSSAISAQQISGENSECKKNLRYKVSQKSFVRSRR